MKSRTPFSLKNVPLPRKLSEELVDLKTRLADRPMTIREVLQTLGGRSYMLLVILLTLPFITPILIPGLSTPFGLAISFIALRLVLGQRPWLPKKIQRKTIPPGFFVRVLTLSARVIKVFEKLLRPRLAWLSHAPLLLRVHAFLMLLSALVLLLPLPIPLSNMFPALSILLMAGGLLERDGLFILLSYVAGAIGAAYFVFLGYGGSQILEVARHWLASHF